MGQALIKPAEDDWQETAHLTTVKRWWCEAGFVYDPKDVFDYLVAASSTEPDKLHERDRAIRGVMTLYSELGHQIDPPVAGGVLELIGNPEHASNIILLAYSRNLNDNQPL